MRSYQNGLEARPKARLGGLDSPTKARLAGTATSDIQALGVLWACLRNATALVEGRSAACLR